MLRVGKLIVLALVAAGCRPDRTVEVSAGEDSWTTVPSRVLQVRVSRFDGDGTIEVVAPPSLEANVAGTVRGPAVAGTTLPVQIAGVPCTVAVLGRYEETVSKSERPKAEGVRRLEAPQTRTLRGLNLAVSCGEAPVPGSDAAQVGVRAVPGVAWGLPALALGLLAGILARAKEFDGRPLGAAAGALGCAVGLAVWSFSGTFAITYAVLFVGLAVGGMGVGHLDLPHPWKATAVGAAGLVIGTVGVAAAHGLWGAGGPVLALLGAGAASGLGLVVVALAAD